MGAIGESITVLHVDDEPDYANLVATFLEREDDRFSIDTATSATEGLDRLTEGDYDCIISDYDMPGQNGIEFLRAVREDYPDLPFILFTGKGSEEVASEAISAGVSDYLQKGGTDQYTLLANRVTNLVSQYRAIATVEEYASEREESEQYRQQLLELVSDAGLSEDEKIDRLLTLGCERLDTENGHLVIIDEEADRHEVISVSGSDIVREGVTDLSETYCRKTIESDEILDVYHASDQGWTGDPAYERFGLECYIGGKLTADSQLFGTLCFADREPRKPFTPNEKAFFDVLVQWFSQMVERRQRLNQSETVFEHTQDALFLIDVIDDHTFTIRSVNRAYEDLTGYSSTDLKGQSPRELLSDEQGAEVEARYQECIEKREPIEYNEQLTLGETTKYWHTRLAPVIENNRVKQLVGATRDVTDRKEREARLEALNETAQELMTASTQAEVAEIGVTAAQDVLNLELSGIHLYDDEQQGLVPVAQTEESKNLVGEAPTLTEGDSIAWRIYESGESVAIDDIRDDPDVHEADTPVQSELYLPIGEYGILITASETPDAFDREDIILGELLASTIATALKQIERTEQLRDRERSLEGQNERLEAFASVVSHDLRNPLEVANAGVELAREDCESTHLHTIDQAHDRMKALIDDLLTLAREGDRVSDIEAVDLAKLSEDCWRNVETIDATVQTPTERTVRADRSRLAQLLENLIRNAVEHGGGDVTVTVGDLDDGFYVEDDGPGIPEDEYDDVFDAGYSSGEDGTGFGLNIVEGVAEAHGWDIHVTDGAAGGARFEFTGVESVE